MEQGEALHPLRVIETNGQLRGNPTMQHYATVPRMAERACHSSRVLAKTEDGMTPAREKEPGIGVGLATHPGGGDHNSSSMTTDQSTSNS